MLGIPCEFDPARHVILHAPLESWLKRNLSSNLRDPLFRGWPLFLYYSLDGNAFVIGQWVGRDKRLFQDVWNIGDSLLDFTWEDAQQVLDMFGNPRTGEDLSNEMRDGYKNKLLALQDKADRDASVLAWNNKTHALSGYGGLGGSV